MLTVCPALITIVSPQPGTDGEPLQNHVKGFPQLSEDTLTHVALIKEN